MRARLLRNALPLFAAVAGYLIHLYAGPGTVTEAMIVAAVLTALLVLAIGYRRREQRGRFRRRSKGKIRRGDGPERS